MAAVINKCRKERNKKKKKQERKKWEKSNRKKRNGKKHYIFTKIPILNMLKVLQIIFCPEIICLMLLKYSIINMHDPVKHPAYS